MSDDSSVLYDDLETFKENFSQAIRDENFEVQIDMTKKLGILAQHLGEEITRKELLPFIKENIDFHDEILLNLSEQLKQFIPLVGGYEYSEPVLDLLKKLCKTDENVVRDKTVETLKNIAEDLNSELTEQLLVPVLDALANEDWFTSKCSAVALFPFVYSKVKEERKEELRHNFRLLSQDDSPIVRKAAALCLVDFIPILDNESIKNEFISVFDNISRDDMDSVQVHAIRVAIAISKRLSETEIDEYIFKTLEEFSEKPSWRIRQVLALNIAEIQEIIPSPKQRGKILAMFQKLIKDSEEEVRIVSCRNLVDYCRSLKRSYERQSSENNFTPVFLQSIVPQVALLQVDASVDVRLALTRNILSLSSIISKEVFIQHIMPIVVDILEEEVSIPVKAGILENLNDLPQDIDFAQSLPSVKKVIRTLIVYSQSYWRTRKGLLVTFMHIARFSSKEYFSENLKIFYASLLGDPIFAVRRTAPIILPLLAKQYGMIWTTRQIIPYFKMFTKDTRYLYRYVPLFGINELLKPSIMFVDDIKYLSSLKENKEIPISAVRELLRLKYLLKKLSDKLKEKHFEDILSLNKSIDDFKSDNISLYAGETVNNLRPYSTDIFIYKTDKPNDWYLTGLVTLIYREFLDIILYLFDDNIVNVQIRSIFTLNRIKIFTDSLSKELEETWISDSLKDVSAEEWTKIEEEVESDLKQKECLKIDEENIDTELMDKMFTSSDNNINFRNDQDDTNTPEISIEYADDVTEVNIDDKIKESNDKVSAADDIKNDPLQGDQVVEKENEQFQSNSEEKVKLPESNIHDEQPDANVDDKD